MYRLLLFTFIHLICINLIFAKEYGNKCYHADYPDYLNVGETASVPGKCLEIKCLKDKTVEIMPCPYTSKKGCKHTKIDFTKPYPECCPILQC